MAADLLYEISDLSCAYRNVGKTVLHVHDLAIPRERTVAILGLSGIGKSTLLETLGLMNNTIVPSSKTVFRFYGENGGEVLDFSNVWNSRSDRVLSRIRNRHFSFIFQETNLMPNFSAMENIMLTLMLQGLSRKEARQLGMEYLEKVGMGEIDPTKKVFELSGGQRQRLAFVRAISPRFTVLMGDEPTGNLDRFTSRKLMQILKASILEKRGSAIIVTHDIELSVDFADQIIVINKGLEQVGEINEFHGTIDSASVFTLSGEGEQRSWRNGQGSFSDTRMAALIRELLDSQSGKT